MLGWVGVKSGVRRHFESIKRIKVIFRVLLTEGEAHVHFHREVPADQGGLDVGTMLASGRTVATTDPVGASTVRFNASGAVTRRGCGRRCDDIPHPLPA